MKAAVEEMQNVIDELQKEVCQFSEKMVDWYELNLQLLNSGLMTKPQFDRDVWKERQTMHTCFDDDLYAMSRMIVGLGKRYESFKQLEEHLQRVIESQSCNKPADWKEWSVRFKDSVLPFEEERKIFGPSSNYAAQMVVNKFKQEYNTIEIVEVKEVES